MPLFIWLVILVFIVIIVTFFYDSNKKEQLEILKKTFKNIYLQKTFKNITSNLEPRFITFNYNVRQGDTYESIINEVNIT